MKNQAKPDLIQSLVKNFSKLERRQKRFMDNALRPAGIYGMMYKFIVTVKRHPGTSQDFLAEFHSVDKSRIARAVRELEKAGYISRAVNEHNRRSYRLFLTEEGERLYGTVQQALMDWGSIISKNIPAENLLITINTTEKMITNVG